VRGYLSVCWRLAPQMPVRAESTSGGRTLSGRISPIARSLVMLEALLCQLLPVALIARLVTLEIEHQRMTRQP
jgi:hypothetical protein